MEQLTKNYPKAATSSALRAHVIAGQKFRDVDYMSLVEAAAPEQQPPLGGAAGPVADKERLSGEGAG